jgi:hypothetical protein
MNKIKELEEQIEDLNEKVAVLWTILVNSNKEKAWASQSLKNPRNIIDLANCKILDDENLYKAAKALLGNLTPKNSKDIISALEGLERHEKPNLDYPIYIPTKNVPTANN